MKSVICFIFSINCLFAHQCLFPNRIEFERVYLCREKFNSTSIRIWLYLNLNQTNRYHRNFFAFYTFNLRVMELVEEKHHQFDKHFEKQITDYIQINSRTKENHTINIHNLSPGRYEICVNFYQKKSPRFYSRSTNSCLYVPWNVPEHDYEYASRFIQTIFMILIILLLPTSAFFVYSIYKYIESRRPRKIPIADEEEELDDSEKARFLVNQHFSDDISPLRLLVHRRMHKRYAHRSPDLNESKKK